jgi:hypothetical protein
VNALKATFWFGAGMAFSELVMRWPVHLAWGIVVALLIVGRWLPFLHSAVC